MSDIALSLERAIDASPDAVWRVLTDLEGSEAVLSGVARIERLAGFGYAIGTRWRETRTVMGPRRPRRWRSSASTRAARR